MSSIVQLRSDIRRYSALKGSVSAVIFKLSAALPSLGRVDTRIRSDYQVSGKELGINKRTVKLERSIKETVSQLEDTLRAIDVAMDATMRQIAILEEQERQGELL